MNHGTKCAYCHRELHFEIGNGVTILSEVLNKRKRAETLQGKPKSKLDTVMRKSRPQTLINNGGENHSGM